MSASAGARELVDCHTHTRYSDGEPTIEQNVARAAELGLTTIACTDHFVLPADIDPLCEVSVPADRVSAYMADVAAARAAHPEIDVVLGWECDYYDGCEAYLERYRGGATFLLGSVHMLERRWIDDGDDLSYWDEHGTQAVWERYFATWCAACACPVGFSSMAHPDLVRKFGRIPQDGALLARLFDEAAQAAREAGVHIEVSSAGLTTACHGFYPTSALLVAFCRAGVPITVGSDAHNVARIGDHIAALYDYAYTAGYRSVDVPTSDGGWRKVDL